MLSAADQRTLYLYKLYLLCDELSALIKSPSSWPSEFMSNYSNEQLGALVTILHNARASALDTKAPESIDR